MGCMRDHWRKDGTTESCRGEPVVRRRHDRRRYLMKCRRESMPVELEWLEPDGLGGFASGPVAGHRPRRYHALLLAATTPPTGRMVLVNGFDAWLERPGLRGGRRDLTSPRYTPDGTTGGAAPTIGFPTLPGPTWTHRLAGGLEVSCELFVPRRAAVAALRWRARNPPPGLRLVVRQIGRAHV